jgi:hypothetical protein
MLAAMKSLIPVAPWRLSLVTVLCLGLFAAPGAVSADFVFDIDFALGDAADPPDRTVSVGRGDVGVPFEVFVDFTGNDDGATIDFKGAQARTVFMGPVDVEVGLTPVSIGDTTKHSQAAFTGGLTQDNVDTDFFDRVKANFFTADSLADGFGVFSGTFDVPEDATLGTYSLEFRSNRTLLINADGLEVDDVDTSFVGQIVVGAGVVVPEPGSLLLVGFAATGLGGIGLLRYRRDKKKTESAV